MSKQLREIQARKASLVKEARSITDIAAGEDRDLNDEEVTSFDALKARIDAASTAIDREAALIAEEARLATSAATGPIVTDHRENDPMHGFANVGEFMVAVYHAEKYGKAPDGRLLIGGGMNAAAPSSFANEPLASSMTLRPHSHKLLRPLATHHRHPAAVGQPAPGLSM